MAVYVVSTITHKNGSESPDQPKSNGSRLLPMPAIISNIDEFKAGQSLYSLLKNNY